MELHKLKREHPNKKSRQVGRGGTRGKTSGRGGKGQTARAGNKRRPQMRDIIKKIPKLRGYRFNSVKEKYEVVNLGQLNLFADGSVVSPKVLVEKKLVKMISGKLPKVKVLAKGDLKVKLSIENCFVSEAAIEKIKKAGGTIK